MTKENDIVLIYVENVPVSFARVESILADAKRDWYHIKLLFLQIPLQIVTWILKDTYINGEEFSMGGKLIRLEPVKCPEKKNIDDKPFTFDKILTIDSKKDQRGNIQGNAQNETIDKKEKQDKQAKIISLADIRKLKKKK